MSTTNPKRAAQRQKRIEAMEASSRRAYFSETDSVLELIRHAPEAKATMRAEILWEIPADTVKKVVKLYDADTGATETLMKEKKTEDEYPCLRLISYGFIAAVVLFALAAWIAHVVG